MSKMQEMKRIGKQGFLSAGILHIVSSVIILCPVLLMFAGISSRAEAQNRTGDITATASVNTNRLSVGDRLILTLELSGPSLRDVERPALPEMEGITALSRIPTTTTGLSIINGVSTSTKGFRFTLEVTQPGKLTIPEIELRSGGNVYRTQSLQLDVQQRGAMQQNTDQQRENDIYLQLELSREQPFAGEQVIAEVVLYFHSDLSIISYQPASAWHTEGFWMERLDEENGPRAETIMKNGMEFRRAVLMRYALFPTRSGTLRLGEYEVRANVRATRRFGNTRRFFDDNRRRAMDLRSRELQVEVKPLPQPRPDGFTGAVGQFRVERSVSEQEVIIGEPLEIETVFTGEGNINLLNKPEYDISERFEAFRPTESQELQKSVSGISGSKMFTDILISRRAGRAQIPEAEVYWFDPQAETYRSALLASIDVNVLRDPDAEFLYVENDKLRIGVAGGAVDWHFAGSGPASKPAVYTYTWFWVLLGIPFITLSAGFIRRRFLQRLASDKGFARARNAEKVALEKLESADQRAGSGQLREAYSLLGETLDTFVADRMNLSPTGRSASELIDILREKQVDAALLTRIEALLKKIKYISFAPNVNESQYDADRQECLSLIKALKKKC